MTRSEAVPGTRVRCPICGAFTRRGLYCYRTVRCVQLGSEAELREALAWLAAHGVVHEPVPAEVPPLTGLDVVREAGVVEVPLALPQWDGEDRT